jgi:hypothetical protein
MAYADVAALADDPDFNRRYQACYAIETLNAPSAAIPSTWAAEHYWDMAAQPGFGDAYAYAILTHPTDPEAPGYVPDYRPGNDPGVITDAQILGAVQSLMGQGMMSA